MDDLINIKKADGNDSQLLFNLGRQTYSENFADHWDEGGLAIYLDRVYKLENINTELANPCINYFIAYYNEEPVGFMKLNFNSNLPDHQSSSGMEIEKIYFLPRFKKKGIGKKLMSLAIEMGNKLGKDIIWLEVIDTNLNAIGFYKKMGFRIHSKTTMSAPYFKDELRGMWRMILHL